jgi:alpha-beta hydrolase superfamily lysophospholipase
MKEKKFDINENGMSIRCLSYSISNIKDAENIVVATYGFGGKKENHAISEFVERLTGKYKSFAVITFDWPCHGEDARKKLTISECLLYLDIVNKYIRTEFDPSGIYNYSSSFGAYITLLYIHLYNNPYNKIGLRCPAIGMYDAMLKNIDNDGLLKLKKGKEILIGFDRKMKISSEFFDELKENDISKFDYIDYADQILMIQGTCDEMVPIALTEKFSDKNVIELIEVDGADHPFSNPKHMDTAIHSIIEFFAE